MIKVVAVHTAMALVEPMNQIFRQWLPEVKLNHIADDSLIQEVIALTQYPVYSFHRNCFQLILFDRPGAAFWSALFQSAQAAVNSNPLSIPIPVGFTEYLTTLTTVNRL